MVECRTPEREVGGSKPTAALLCPWARHFTPQKYWLITQEAMAPSRHDWKIADWDVKPQHKQTVYFKVCHQYESNSLLMKEKKYKECKFWLFSSPKHRHQHIFFIAYTRDTKQFCFFLAKQKFILEATPCSWKSFEYTWCIQNVLKWKNRQFSRFKTDCVAETFFPNRLTEG